ncbi:variable large family protein (plasmid) [Borrelia coriaceae]|uniref:Variable large protein n=1 Tax=Borrelia coriaceae ATCC 43381 TaxID=1408429 RepID=W5SXY2_9SPIR|nr:variable large family protein [Borrelia coriaceae]AHH11563.1 Variable outer membrane protein [Borrelia coriaceae ATCC 43381]UPA17306.1 variable large family protein [Borrelia coriaceae]
MKINIKNIRVKSICATLFISLFLSCNNGMEELQKENQSLRSISNLRQQFLDVFTSFGDMMTGTLGFEKDPKKAAVAKYFKSIGDSLTKTRTSLEKMVENMRAANNFDAGKVETEVTTLNKILDTVIAGAKTASEAIGTENGELLGNIDVASGNAKGVPGDVTDLVKGIKAIVDVVLQGKGEPVAGDNKKSDDGTVGAGARGDNAGEAGNLFANSAIASNAKKAASDVTKAVGAVSGSDLLQAMVKNDDSMKLAKYAGAAGSIGINASNDGTIAGAIALRAMAKGGKFANGNVGDDVTVTVKGAALSAITKALNTLTIAIRKTVDDGFKKVKDVMNISDNDTAVSTESSTAAK